jgi:murein DD-endopeptidase MepM/ murein hydrolase activator NlpD
MQHKLLKYILIVLIIFAFYSPTVFAGKYKIKKLYIEPGQKVSSGQIVALAEDITHDIQKLHYETLKLQQWVSKNSFYKKKNPLIDKEISLLSSQLEQNISNHNTLFEIRANTSGIVDKIAISEGDLINRKDAFFITKAISTFRNTSISSGFGYRTNPVSGLPDHHNGIDIPLKTGTPVYAYADGFVSQLYKNSNGNAGKYIGLSHDDNTDTYYMHLSTIIISDGQYVNKGDLIGYSGNTGRTTGPHLHFEIRKNNIPIHPFTHEGIKWYISMY